MDRIKDFKNGICYFSCFNAQHLRAAQRMKKQSMDYTYVKNILIQSWRYKTIAVIKRDKNHLSLSFFILLFFQLIREFLPSMKKKNHGHILAMSSYSAREPAPYLVDYA